MSPEDYDFEVTSNMYPCSLAISRLCMPMQMLSVSKDVVTPTSLIIEEGVMLGSRAIIFPSCNYKGLNAKVGAKPLLQDFK